MRYIATIFLLLCSVLSFSQKKETANSFVRALPDTGKAVNDFGKFLTGDGWLWLENELSAYRERTGNAIVIITLDSLTDPQTKRTYTIEEAALLYFNTWGIGDSIKNNGVLLMASRNPRRVRIQTGKGVQNVLTDYACQVIVNETLVPDFKTGAFFKGVKEAVYAIENKLDKPAQAVESTPAVLSDSDLHIVRLNDSDFHGYKSPGIGPEIVIVCLFLIVPIALVVFVIRMIKQKGGWYSNTGYNNYDTYHRSSNWSSGRSWSSGGSSSSGSSGGSSSSGSSYGGGSSSGGGASGSW
jgi:uncharacterized protein